MKAIIHIGTAKTGSTTIQVFLHRNREALRRQGIAFLRSPGLRNHRKLAAYSMEDSHIDNYIIQQGLVKASDRQAWKNNFASDFELELAELPDSIHTVLISSEHLQSRLIQPKEIENLQKFLSPHFSDIQIVVYLRRQDQVMVSLHSTKLISGGVPEDIFADLDSEDREYRDYAKLFNKWASIFGEENIAVRLFEEGALCGGSLLEDFAAYAHIETLGDFFVPPKLNEKLSRHAQFHLQRLNRKYPRFGRYRRSSLNILNDLTRREVVRKLGAFNKGEPLLPTRAEAEKFYSHFRESNNQLARLVFGRDQLFREDFSIYPTTIEPSRPSPEEIANFDNMARQVRRDIFRERLSTSAAAKWWRGIRGKPKTLYLHIGSHKTGTTSIQRALVSHKQYLAEHDISVFHANPNGKLRAIGNVHPWIRREASENQEIGVLNGFVSALSAIKGNAVMSSEIFSFFLDKDSIDHLVAQLQQCFEHIKVIVYLRRQDKHAVSHHQQGGRNNTTYTSKLYGHHPAALPEYKPELDDYLDYNQRLGLWGDAVGDKNVVIRVFEPDHLYNENAVDDFFHVLGLATQHAVPWENKSKGFVATKVGHLMNQEGLPFNLAKTLADHLDDKGKLVPARSDAMAFYQHYQHSNSMLNKRFQISSVDTIFGDDFSMYPEIAADRWSEASANLAIKNLLSAIIATPSITPEQLSLLEQGAHKLSGIDNVLSRRLLELTEGYSTSEIEQHAEGNRNLNINQDHSEPGS